LQGIIWIDQEVSFYPMGQTTLIDSMVQTLKRAGFTKLWVRTSRELANRWQKENSMDFFHEISEEESLWIFPGNLLLLNEKKIKEIKILHEQCTEVGTCYWISPQYTIFNLLENKSKKAFFSLLQVAQQTSENFYSLVKEAIFRENLHQVQYKEEFFVIDSPIALAKGFKILRFRVNQKHMEKGVVLLDPDQTYIDQEVEIGVGTIVYPGTFLQGKTQIGENCIIGPHTRIVNSKLDSNISIEYSVILNSTIGKASTIGPFAYIRPHSHIGSNVKIGDFVEVKNATIADNTKASHLTYVGDADVGRNVNFGCGVITVNYDGDKKYRTIIEDNAFIGCNSNLVAPVTIREGSFIAAGSTITKEVPEGALAIARMRQENKEGWRRKNKKK